MTQPLVPAALTAVGLTALLTPLVTLVLYRLDVIDHPNARSSHVRATVRGGGLAPALAVATVGIVYLRNSAGLDSFPLWTGVLVCALGFGLLGLVEDVLQTPPLFRFICQLLLAAGSAPWLLAPSAVTTRLPSALAVAVLVFWLAAYANCFNFMDGINGISAISVLVAGLTWFLVGSAQRAEVLAGCGALLAAAALGFLPYNFPKARVFLGDVGSYFFGAALGALVLAGLAEGVPPEALLGPLALPLADTGTTLLRRILRRQAWHLPHRDHVFHRLFDHGWSHARTTLTFGLLLSTCAALGAVSTLGLRPLRLAADALVLIVVGAYLAAPALVQAHGSRVGPRPPAPAWRRGEPDQHPAVDPDEAGRGARVDAYAGADGERSRGVRR